MWVIKNDKGQEIASFGSCMKDFGPCGYCGDKTAMMYAFFWRNGFGDGETLFSKPMCQACFNAWMRGKPLPKKKRTTKQERQPRELCTK